MRPQYSRAGVRQEKAVDGVKIGWIGCLLVCVLCLPVFAQSQAEPYQAGKIVAVEKLPEQGGGGGTDAAEKAGTQDYDISIQVAGTVYICRYHAESGEDLSWLQDKEKQVRIKGKVMYMKRATGKDAKAAIIRTTKAD